MLHIRTIWPGSSKGTVADITNTSPYLHWEQRVQGVSQSNSGDICAAFQQQLQAGHERNEAVRCTTAEWASGVLDKAHDSACPAWG